MDTKSLPGGLVYVDDAHVIDLTCAEDEAEFPTDIKSDDPFKTRIKEDVFHGFPKCAWFDSIDDEFVDFYPRRKVVTSSTSVEIIKQADIYKYDPFDLPKDEAELAWLSRFVEFPTDIKSDDPFKTSINEDHSAVSLKGLQSHATDAELAELHLLRKIVIVMTNSTNMEIIKQADIYKYDPWDLPKYNTVRECDWYFYCKRGRKYRNCLRPGRVTGSGFWKARGINMPTHSSNVVKTGSVNNRWETYTSIFDSMDNHHHQRYALPTNVGPEYRNGYGYNSSGGETSTTRHHSYVPQVHVDIFNEIDQIMVENGNNGHTYLAIYQAWNEYKNRLKISKFDDDAMKMMSGIFVAVAGQFIAGVMANRLTSSASSSSWAAPIVELATVFGLCVTLLGISLRAKSRSLSTLLIKIGAVTTAWAIIFSMGSHLPPVMAWTVGPVAFLIMALAAAFA